MLSNVGETGDGGRDGGEITDLCDSVKIPMGLIQQGAQTPQQQWEDASDIMRTIGNCATFSLCPLEHQAQGTVRENTACCILRQRDKKVSTQSSQEAHTGL